MDRGAWQAIVHGVSKSQTRLKQRSSIHSISWLEGGPKSQRSLEDKGQGDVRQRGSPREAGGSDGSDVSTGQEHQGLTAAPRSQGEAGLSLRASRRESSLRAPWSQTAGLRDCETECLWF